MKPTPEEIDRLYCRRGIHPGELYFWSETVPVEPLGEGFIPSRHGGVGNMGGGSWSSRRTDGLLIGETGGGVRLSDYLKTHEISSPSMGEARWGCIERRFISPSPCPSHQGRGVLR